MCPATESGPCEPAPPMLQCVCGSCSHVAHSTAFPLSEALPVHARPVYICAAARYMTTCQGVGRINQPGSIKSQVYHRCLISVSAKQYTMEHMQLQCQAYIHTAQHVACITCSRLKPWVINSNQQHPDIGTPAFASQQQL